MAQWFYGENGQQQGPVDDAEFSALVAAQRITPATIVWREGMPEWAPFWQVQSGGGNYPPAVSMMNPVTSGQAIASLVCGIVALVSCLVPLGIPAVICGHIALNQIAKSPVPMVGRGMAFAGLISGYLTTLIFLAGIGFLIFSAASFTKFP